MAPPSLCCAARETEAGMAKGPARVMHRGRSSLALRFLGRRQGSLLLRPGRLLCGTLNPAHRPPLGWGV